MVQGTDRVILLRDLDRRQFLNTQLPYGANLPPAVPLSALDLAKLKASRPLVSDVYASPMSAEYRIAVALPVRGPQGEKLASRHHRAHRPHPRSHDAGRAGGLDARRSATATAPMWRAPRCTTR